MTPRNDAVDDFASSTDRSSTGFSLADVQVPGWLSAAMSGSDRASRDDSKLFNNRIDRRKFVAGAGATVAAVAGSALLPNGLAAAGLPAGASKFVPLEPFRVLDTRLYVGGAARVVGPRRYRLSMHSYFDVLTRQQVSPTASSIVVNLTTRNGSSNAMNVIRMFPSSAPLDPAVSIMNPYRPYSDTANMVTCKLSNSGEFDVACERDAEVIIDVLGYYEPAPNGSREGRYSVSEPIRLYDSRNNRVPVRPRGSIVVDVTRYTASDTSAVVINLTGVNANSAGFLSAIPVWQGREPTTSTLNFNAPGDTVAGSAIVPVRTIGGRRSIRIYGWTGCDVVVDLQGQYSGSNSVLSTRGLFVPVTPKRILDTRLIWRDRIGSLGRLWDKWFVEAPLTRHPEITSTTVAQIGAVAVNLSAIFSRPNPGTSNGGYLLVSAAGLPVGEASTTNWTSTNSFSANHATPATSWDGLQVKCIGGAGVLIDVAGYYLGSPKRRTMPVPTAENQSPPPIGPPWSVAIPNLYSSTRRRYGITKNVVQGANPDRVVDRGDIWHWTNTGDVAERARRTVIFGHRTSADAVYRNIHVLPVGSLMYIDTTDGRRYTYRYVGKALARPTTSDILRAAAICPTPSVSVVACTAGYARPGRKWYEPTSLAWRIVSTFQFVGWQLISDR